MWLEVETRGSRLYGVVIHAGLRLAPDPLESRLCGSSFVAATPRVSDWSDVIITTMSDLLSHPMTWRAKTFSTTGSTVVQILYYQRVQLYGLRISHSLDISANVASHICATHFCVQQNNEDSQGNPTAQASTTTTTTNLKRNVTRRQTSQIIVQNSKLQP